MKAAKPSPEGLLLAIKRLHVSKAETLYIGDSTVDVGYGDFGGRNQVEVVHFAMIHLPFLVRQLSRAVALSLIHICGQIHLPKRNR